MNTRRASNRRIVHLEMLEGRNAPSHVGMPSAGDGDGRGDRDAEIRMDHQRDEKNDARDKDNDAQDHDNDPNDKPGDRDNGANHDQDKHRDNDGAGHR